MLKKLSIIILFVIIIIIIIIIWGLHLYFQHKRVKQIIENENKAKGRILEIWDAQNEFKGKCYVDQNNNGIGEYGLFQELSGIVISRSGKKIDTTLISKRFGKTAKKFKGIAYLDGYYYKIYLPTNNGIYSEKSFPKTNIAFAANQEKYCVIYAWPEKYGITGTRAWCAKLDRGKGTFTVCKNRYRQYSGLSNVPEVWASFKISNQNNKKDIYFNNELNLGGKRIESFDSEGWHRRSEK